MASMAAVVRRSILGHRRIPASESHPLINVATKESYYISSLISSFRSFSFHGNNDRLTKEQFTSDLSEVDSSKGRELGYGSASGYGIGGHALAFLRGTSRCGTHHGSTVTATFPQRFFSTVANPVESQGTSEIDAPARIKFKRPDKTARHIMQILDKEAVEEVKVQREVPDVKPGYVVQLKLEVPENKRRVTTIKGIVIARRNAGLNTTFRIRRLVAGVGVESLLPLYSPNIKEIKVLDKKKVRRAKLYYLREKMNALKK